MARQEIYFSMFESFLKKVTTELSGTELKILLAMLGLVDTRKNVGQANQKTISDFCKINQSTVCRAMKSLEAKGYIKTWKIIMSDKRKNFISFRDQALPYICKNYSIVNLKGYNLV